MSTIGASVSLRIVTEMVGPSVGRESAVAAAGAVIAAAAVSTAAATARVRYFIVLLAVDDSWFSAVPGRPPKCTRR
ncbi:hypothetical protein NJ76_26400 [Rhodococcus sp. IITR03]|nr:hypothetical protein NJ76_26400 [Rhodococcus sp. IITR03]